MKKTLFLILSAIVTVSVPSLRAEPLAVGAEAPADLKAKDQNGNEVDLGAVFKEGVTLVYFYPKAMTPGCTRQACNLRDSGSALIEAGIKVFGVSHDTVDDQKKFTDQEKINFTLIADADRKVSEAFGVPDNAKGFASRQSFLIKNGKIIFHQPQANPLTQAEDAIAALKKHD